MQRACDGGCTTRFEFPCSSEARKENIQRRRNCCDPRYLMMITSNCWSANKVHEHGQIVRFCHSVADLAWKHHWNTRKLWNNMFSVFFSGVCFQMRYRRMFCHKLGSKRRFGFFRGERGLRAKVTTLRCLVSAMASNCFNVYVFLMQHLGVQEIVNIVFYVHKNSCGVQGWHDCWVIRVYGLWRDILRLTLWSECSSRSKSVCMLRLTLWSHCIRDQRHYPTCIVQSHQSD